MKNIYSLGVEIYQNLKEGFIPYEKRVEKVKQYILTEITQWKIKKLVTSTVISFKPLDFTPTLDSPYFEVRLYFLPEMNLWELKFGNLNETEYSEQYRWNRKDPNRMAKALFLVKVLENEVAPLLRHRHITGLVFEPYNEDGLGEDRLSYFKNMWEKLKEEGFSWEKINNYYVVK